MLSVVIFLAALSSLHGHARACVTDYVDENEILFGGNMDEDIYLDGNEAGSNTGPLEGPEETQFLEDTKAVGQQTMRRGENIAVKKGSCDIPAWCMELAITGCPLGMNSSTAHN